MANDLSKCPFCGGVVKITKDDFPQAYAECNGYQMRFSRCYEYDIDGLLPDDATHFINAWNTRQASSNQTQELVEALKFYADGKHYEIEKFRDLMINVCIERGHKAQAALAKFNSASTDRREDAK